MTCSHLLFKTYLNWSNLIVLSAAVIFLAHFVISACLLTRFIIAQSEDMKVNCTKLFVSVIWAIEYMS